MLHSWALISVRKANPDATPVAIIACALLTVFLWAGCAPAPLPSEHSRLHAEAGQVSQIRADIGFLDGPETEGRETASRGYARTATYLAQQLRMQGLQPVLSGEFRMQYAASIRRVVHDNVAFVGQDTTRLQRGSDYLLVGTTESVQNVGESHLLEIPGLIWRADLELDASSLDMDIRVDMRATTAPMHVMGFIPGADPLQRDSVVVWLAPSDAIGMQGDQSWTDGSDLSIPSAALMAAARRASSIQQAWASFPQTILVAFVSGTQDACQGPTMLARHFPWEVSRISRVVIADMPSSSRCDWGALFSHVPGGVNVVEALQPFAAPADFGFGPFRPRSEMQRSDVLDAAISEALRLSEALLDLLP